MSGLIYALADPLNGEIRYCGKTTQRWLCQRLAVHKADALVRKSKRHVSNWIRQVYERGDEPQAIVCETISFDGLARPEQLAKINAAEIWWIAELKSMGFNLTNHTLGGDGHHGSTMSEESRAKTRAAHLGVKRSEEAKARMRAAQRARDPSKYRGRAPGSKISEGHKAALKAGAIEYNNRPEVKALAAEKMRGNKRAKQKLTEQQVVWAREARDSHQAIADALGVSRSLISQIRRGERHATNTS